MHLHAGGGRLTEFQLPLTPPPQTALQILPQACKTRPVVSGDENRKKWQR
jgi:hypothetical protein